MNLTEYVSIIGNTIQSIAVIVASVVAIKGIGSWKREKKWTKKYELAEEVLTLFYEAEEAIKSIRSPLVWSNEGKSRKRNVNESKEESELLDNAYVVYERYEKEKHIFNKLRSLKYRFKAIYREDKIRSFEELNLILNEILLSSNDLGKNYWPRQGRVDMTEPEFKRHLQEMHEKEDMIWAAGDENKMTKRINKTIKEIEAICSEIIIKGR
jgi:hypothetical protein